MRSTLNDYAARLNSARARSSKEQRALKSLKGRAFSAPRHEPGSIELSGFEIEYIDLLSLWFEYKDIFCNRIYHFDSDEPAPRVIDGGGFVGMSVLYAKQEHPGARITCFEPDPGVLAVLRRNVEANGLEDVELVQAGLAAEKGTAAFTPDGADGGRITDAGGESEIATVPLSSYLEEPVDFLKLNIEGLELPVLREAAGALPLVREMVIEYHGWPNQPQRLGEILELLGDAGFRYLVNHFDYETNPATRPPFSLSRDGTWFALVYARRADLL